jgi:hypothetical protein
MAGQEQSRSSDESRVVNFRRGQAGVRPRATAKAPVEDLAKYEGPEPAGDYRNRMIVNVLAFLFVAMLAGAGLWLADTMARMRKDQDCFLSGRRGCAPIEVTKNRW